MGWGTPRDSPGTHRELVPRAGRRVSESRGRANLGPPPGERESRGGARPGAYRKRFFSHFRCQKSNFLKKSRAARATTTTTTSKNRDLATDDSKIEDPAKMTHSIPDFVSRNATNNQEFFQYLESRPPITKINT